jgi:hypothetical protein
MDSIWAESFFYREQYLTAYVLIIGSKKYAFSIYGISKESRTLWIHYSNNHVPEQKLALKLQRMTSCNRGPEKCGKDSGHPLEKFSHRRHGHQWPFPILVH